MMQRSDALDYHAMSQKNMTTPEAPLEGENCPAESLLKQLSGKWKPQIFRLALSGPLRFNALLRQLPGASKQSLAIALRELEESGLLEKKRIREKPLHIEYKLSTRGRALIQVFEVLEEGIKK
jgi:DNA-binding HxlR family transcriptional regulator